MQRSGSFVDDILGSIVSCLPPNTTTAGQDSTAEATNEMLDAIQAAAKEAPATDPAVPILDTAAIVAIQA